MDSQHEGPVVQISDISFDVSLNKLLIKYSRGRWLEMAWNLFDFTVIRFSTEPGARFTDGMKLMPPPNLESIATVVCLILSYLILKLKNMEIRRLTDRNDGRMEGRRNKGTLIHHQTRLWGASDVSRERDQGHKELGFCPRLTFLPTWTTIGTGKSLRENTVNSKRITRMRRNTTPEPMTCQQWFDFVLVMYVLIFCSFFFLSK